MYYRVKLILFLLSCGCLLGSCATDFDDVISPAGTDEIKDFIWKGMNNIYLYKSDIPALANDRFETQGELNDFLDNFNSPESLFYNGLVASYDGFSFLVDDYIELERAFDGISRANGMQYGLVRFSSTSDLVIGYVRYVLPNTPAEAQGLERGDLFTSIDGETMTMDNYARLLQANTYTIGLAEWNGAAFTSTGEEVTLEKIEYTENPIYLTQVLETSTGKVGYLIYNSFTANFDDELNAAFASFKAEGINNLIVDLRYNGGGSVESSVDLASMITGQFDGKIFSREEWNEDYQTYYEENNPESLLNLFNNKIRTGEAINSLNLSKVYVITTLRTASASELLINGLEPYIDAIQVGDTTTGKFQASTTLYDSADFGRQGANPGHTYAIQPLIYKSINSAGVTDYIDGLYPDITIVENITNLGVLGDPSEPLLQAAINDIEGTPQMRMKSHQGPRVKHIGESGMDNPLYQKMYTADLPPIPKRTNGAR